MNERYNKYVVNCKDFAFVDWGIKKILSINVLKLNC